MSSNRGEDGRTFEEVDNRKAEKKGEINLKVDKQAKEREDELRLYLERRNVKEVEKDTSSAHKKSKQDIAKQMLYY